MSIYDYDNYVCYLNDWFKEQKEENKKFSHQYFAQKAGIKSRSFMANILNESRVLNPKHIHTVASALELKSKETKYFEALVYYKDSKEIKSKNHYFQIAQKLKPQTKMNMLKLKQYEYFQKWYYPVLRELLTYFDFNGDYKLLGQQLIPHVPPVEVKKAVDLLLELGLIKKVLIDVKQSSSKIVQNRKKVLYEQTEEVIFGDDAYETMAIRSFQEVTLDLAKTALSEGEKSKRNFATYTFSTDNDGVKEINDLMMEFQEKLIGIVNSHPNIDSTHQLNVQMFPLTVGKEDGV